MCTSEHICCKFAHDGLLDIHCLKGVRVPPDKLSHQDDNRVSWGLCSCVFSFTNIHCIFTHVAACVPCRARRRSRWGVPLSLRIHFYGLCRPCGLTPLSWGFCGWVFVYSLVCRLMWSQTGSTWTALMAPRTSPCRCRRWRNSRSKTLLARRLWVRSCCACVCVCMLVVSYLCVCMCRVSMFVCHDSPLEEYVDVCLCLCVYMSLCVCVCLLSVCVHASNLSG